MNRILLIGFIILTLIIAIFIPITVNKTNDLIIERNKILNNSNITIINLNNTINYLNSKIDLLNKNIKAVNESKIRYVEVNNSCPVCDFTLEDYTTMSVRIKWLENRLGEVNDTDYVREIEDNLSNYKKWYEECNETLTRIINITK